MKLFFTLFLSSSMLLAMSQQPISYRLYDSVGNPVQWKKMVDDMNNQELVFFGELHNNPIAHWLQLELTQALHEKNNGKIIPGAEMFETDNQILIDEYFDELISQKNFEKEVRLWNNYQTDYKPLLEFAKKHDLNFIATNIPRRYAALVNKKGFKGLKALSKEAKRWLPPLPVPYDASLPGYAKMTKMAAHMPGKKSGAKNLAKAQAIKDATMAHFIVQNMKKDAVFIHYNGRYHSDNHEGIVWYIRQYAPETRLKTITTVLQKDVSSMQKKHQHLADYVLVINEEVTTTY